VQGVRSAGQAGGQGAKILRELGVFEEVHGGDELVAPGRTMSATFSWREVCRLLDISEGRLRYWDRSGFLSPSGGDGARRFFTFQDLITIRSAKSLLENGVTVQRARKLIEKLRDKLPRSIHPLGKLRIRGDARSVVVVEDDHEFEAQSGQLLIDFSVKSLEESIVAQFPARAETARRDLTAYEWYLEGCRLDEDEALMARAEEAYHRAIYLDPSLANAYTNLGNLRYRVGAIKDAKILYAKAIEVDRNQPEAHYNLGFLEFEDGALETARECFRRAVELDPTFADAHFNLAMTLFRLDEDEIAREHWRRYLALEPTGPWADIARRRLQEAP
jgi:tetratricopeptide (TPR) repeat protein